MKWVFKAVSADDVEIDHSIDELFNNNEVDIQDTLVRETIQNSLDARLEKSLPVEVRFSFRETIPGEFPDSLFTDIAPHLENKLGAALNPAEDEGKLLLIEDFNTKGLEGPIDHKERGTDWFGFFWAMGRSTKGDGSGKGGRRGLGRNVFGICSEIRSFFAFTKRKDDEQTLLMGLSVLGMHSINETDYHPIGHFAIERDDGFRVPVVDGDFLSDVSQTLKLARDGQTGLSIIVPYAAPEIRPQKTLEAAAFNYFVSIWLSELVVRVDDTVLDRSSLKAWLAEQTNARLGNFDELLNFIDETRELDDADFCSPEPWDTQPRRLEPSHFDESTLKNIRQRFEKGELVAVSIPITVQLKNRHPVKTSARAYIKRTPNGEPGRDVYMRGNMPVSGESKLQHAPVFALFQADDDDLFEMLSAAEGAAHWNWNSRFRELHEKYYRPLNSVMMAKNSLKSLYDLLTEADEEVDTKSFADLFPVSDEGDTRPQPVPPPPVPDIPTVPSPITITRLADGIRIHGNADADKDQFPFEETLEVAYLIERRNSFKQFRPSDFELGENINIEAVGDVDVIDLSENQLRFKVDSDQFDLRLRGFDVNRDLDVRITGSEGAGP